MKVNVLQHFSAKPAAQLIVQNILGFQNEKGTFSSFQSLK